MFTISDVENAEPTFDEDAESSDDENTGSIFPIRTSIIITKPTGGALSIEALAQDGLFSIETVSYYQDAKLAHDLTAESDYKRRGTYVGPQFEHLDINLQEGFEAFLSERGIDESLALLIPEYAEWKEQKARYSPRNVIHESVLTINAILGIFRLAQGSQGFRCCLDTYSFPFSCLLIFTSSYHSKQNPPRSWALIRVGFFVCHYLHVWSLYLNDTITTHLLNSPAMSNFR
jgi:hypothetical protein